MWTNRLFKRNKKIWGRLLRRNILSGASLNIKNALILSKMTRYEVERFCNPQLTESQLEKLVRNRGSNFESLLEHHNRHKDYEQYVIDTFKTKGIKTKLLNRLDYDESWIESCDAVFPVGGDGTFLLAASRVRDSSKAVVGFNSDPEHSEGFLCLPHEYSHKVDQVLDLLQEGSFKWMFRTRIRVTLKGKEDESPAELHDKKVLGSHRTKLTMPVSGSQKQMSTSTSSQLPPRHSPLLALNEVFVGESMSAQVSYFEMQLVTGSRGEGVGTKVKSSGVCISTGTGSTSWHLSMNRITREVVLRVLRCAGLMDTDVDTVVDQYNQSLLFDPEDAAMCYTIRDLISAGVWPSPPGLAPCGFAQSILIRSRCRDARLVIDGGASYMFNDGTEALFQIFPQDRLRTIVLR